MTPRSTPPPTPPVLRGFPLLDKQRMAILLNTGPRHIERLVEDGRLGYCRVGRFIRFRVSDLHEFLAANHVAPRQSDR